ncbi:ROK family transcriptional regulator [Goodfellowiella coeruleoviolacea]|uniref:Sugar kinase of the NBD/HSP70 family, may containing an N-terminal HTH domain n=1 Tax=Goodfellowiella coeruleoviolacea TaxID=334858 RepID=A0AAE3KCS4_9PSEU|nr:ROK family transcriptional regulator [Goodfellowiella coeruleoviolacea]MCP2163191.1 Sugar kinase of the NBD/HSP70 family, may containing an N-terminal HTH domain [Goodfellowiella coeruleoviolacea]
MVTAPGSLEALRRHNRLRVLEAVQRRGATSRVEIVRATGLSRTTVSSLVSELLAEQLLTEQVERPTASGSPGGGRPPTLVTLNPHGGGVVGVHLGHDSVRVVVTDLACAVLAEAQHAWDVDAHLSDALDYAARTALDLVAQVGLGIDRVLGAGVAVSTPVRVCAPASAPRSVLTGWDDVNIAEELHARLGLPVHLGNDANLGAMAEWTFGAGRQVDDFIYVMLSDGVGAGLVLGGHLYEGAAGMAGELGHVVVTPDGFVCRCGNRGCLETVAGAGPLVAAMSHSRGADLTLDDVVALCRDGDPGARRVVEDAGRAVGRALAGVCTVLDPRLVVVGGKTAPAGEPLLAGIRAVLARRLSPSINQAVRVVSGELGSRAEVLGAVALVTRSTPGHVLLHG